MRNIFSINRGNIYEATNKLNMWSIVISSNNLHKELNSCVCVSMKIVDGFDKHDDLHVKFESNGVIYKIMPEMIFNSTSSKLGMYKETISDDILEQVIDKVQRFIFGQNLYTLDEARREIADRELVLKTQIEKGCKENIYTPQVVTNEEPLKISLPKNEKTQVKLSLEEEQYLAAKRMESFAEDMIELESLEQEETECVAVATEEAYEDESDRERVPENIGYVDESVIKRTYIKYPLVHQDPIQFLHDYEKLSKNGLMKKYNIDNWKACTRLVYKLRDRLISEGVITAGEIKRKPIKTKSSGINKRLQTFYKNNRNAEDFLLDYYSMDKKEIENKYSWIKSELFYVAQQCRRTYLNNGGDKETLKELMENKKKRTTKTR